MYKLCGVPKKKNIVKTSQNVTQERVKGDVYALGYPSPLPGVFFSSELIFNQTLPVEKKLGIYRNIL